MGQSLTEVFTVARSILLASNESLRMKETSVCSIPDLVDNVGLKINVKRTRNVLSRGRFGEKCAEAIIVGRGRTLENTTVRL
jgi:hypothetical protein